MDLALQPYDGLMLVVLILCTILGAWKGMAWQLAALASLVVSTFVALHFSGPLAPYFSVQEPWNRFLAMLVLYLVTSLFIWLLFRLVAGIIDRVRLREFDRQLGAIFGAAKGVLWCVLITFFAVTLSESARQAVLGTHSGHYTALLIHRATPVLPEEIRNLLGSYIEEFDRKLDPAAAPEETAPSAGKAGRETLVFRCFPGIWALRRPNIRNIIGRWGWAYLGCFAGHIPSPLFGRRRRYGDETLAAFVGPRSRRADDC